jgi:hypothetical protein
MLALGRTITSIAVAMALLSPALLATSTEVTAQTAGRKQNAAAPTKKNTERKQPATRTPFTAADEEIAVVPGIPEARFWADSEQDFARALPSQRGPWIALSAGGSDGAYGAGLLAGWSASGKRPEFALVSGVSSGALMAPYVFLGTSYDDQLRESYSSISAGDVFELGGTPESLVDTWPLRDTIAKRVTPKLLQDVAAEHQKGRRLLVLTTNLDSERFVVWNMGAIATQGDENALKLFREVLLASSSVPGMFQPTFITAEANGRRFQEMHADGGVGAQFFVAPESLLTSGSDYRVPATQLYILINGKLTPEFAVNDRTTVAILGRSVSVAIKAAARTGVDRAYVAAKRSGVDFNLAYVDPGFTQQSKGLFDRDYMQALYKRGFEHGKNGQPFLAQPPELSNRPASAIQ